MTYLKIMALAGLSTLALAAPAAAQDSADAPFNGAYVGGTVGYDLQNNDVNEKIAFDRNLDGTFGDTVFAGGADAFAPGFCNGRGRGRNPDAGCDNDQDNLGYAVRVGVDRQYGNIVAGVVGEFGKSEIRDSVTAFSSTPHNYVMNRFVDWEGSLRLRAGYAANNTLFYGSGGAGYAKIDRSFHSTNPSLFLERGKREQLGFLVGGGIEQKIGESFSVGLEYMYHQYKDDDYRVRATAGPFIAAPNTGGTDFARTGTKFSWNSVRATAAFRF